MEGVLVIKDWSLIQQRGLCRHGQESQGQASDYLHRHKCLLSMQTLTSAPKEEEARAGTPEMPRWLRGYALKMWGRTSLLELCHTQPHKD